MRGTFSGTSRFEVQRRLGTGGFGVVYQVYDHERRQRMALKTLTTLEPASLYRFKREFRAMADITHPNLVSLYELVSIDDEWFFTMEMVEGVDFLAYVRGESVSPRSGEWSSEDTAASSWAFPSRTGEISRSDMPTLGGEPDGEGGAAAQAPDEGPAPRYDEERLRSALYQLAEGLVLLHEAGIAHRDVKPSNVLVKASGQVKLLDFGLVGEIGKGVRGSLDSDVVGTPWYMAPEQCRDSGGEITGKADWYAVGVMLYQALTGRFPFGGSAVEVIVNKQHAEPRAPHELVPDVPPDLGRLCVELLRTRPEERPSDSEILMRLAGVDADEPAVDRPRSSSGERRSPFVPAPLAEFSPRDRELAELDRAFDDARSGRAVAVFLEGRSGMGKTALVRRFLDKAISNGEAVVLSGRCYERESVPYKAFDSLVDALSRYLVRLSRSEAGELTPRDAAALARVFPVLERVEAIASAPRRGADAPDPQRLRTRAFGALRELLSRLADRRPVVLAIDDFQWGDADSAALLADLLRPPDPPEVLLIVCYRTEDVETSAPLRRLLELKDAAAGPDVRTLHVGALDPEETRRLAEALLAGTPERDEALVAAIVRESRGSPFLATELARFVADGAGGVLAAPRGELLDEVVRGRVASLPEDARRLLEVVAVASRPVDVGVAIRAAGLPDEARSHVLTILRSGHLVRTVGSETANAVEPYHNRLREAVLARMDIDALGACHMRLAAALEESGSQDFEALAMHYFAADRTERAAGYAESAAARAAAALAFDQAAQLYQFALDLQPGPRSRASALRVALGESLALAGRGARAAKAFLEAADDASPDAALELTRRAAEQYLRSGHVDEGLRALRAILEAAGLRFPASPRRAIVDFAASSLRLRLRGRSFTERTEAEVPRDLLRKIDACYSAVVGLALTDIVYAAGFEVRYLLLALDAGEPHRVARALGVEACRLATEGGPGRERARRAVVAAMALAERVGAMREYGVAVSAAGLAAYEVGEWREARRLFERGVAILRDRCTGAAWEINSARVFWVSTLYYLGRLQELAHTAPQLVREAEERGDLYASANIRTGPGNAVWLAANDPEGARREIDDAMQSWSRQGFHLQHYGELFARAQVEIYAGRPAEARDLLEARWSALAAAHLLRVQRIRVEALHLRARAAVALAGGRARGDLLDSAERDARRVERERTDWGAPLAGCVRAAVALARGRDREAAGRLAAAAMGFDLADMRLYAAATRFTLGRLRGGDEGRSLRRQAGAAMTGEGVRDPERFAAMLVPGFSRDV